MSDKNLLTDAISNIDDRFLDEYFETKRSYARKGKPMKKKYIIILVAVLAFACMAGFTAGPAVVEHIMQAIPKGEIKIDPANYDAETGELKDEYVLDLVNEIFENKSHPYTPVTGYISGTEEKNIKEQLSDDIRAMDYLARKYPDNFKPRESLICDNDKLELKYIEKMICILEMSDELTEDQTNYLIAYVGRRKWRIKDTDYSDRYRILVGTVRINEAIAKYPILAEDIAKRYEMELTPEQKALAEKNEEARLARLEAESEAEALSRQEEHIKAGVDLSRYNNEEDTSRLTTQGALDMYYDLIESGKLIPRDKWEALVPEVQSIVEQSREAGEADKSRLTTAQELDVYEWLVGYGKLLSREWWEIVSLVEQSREAGESDITRLTTRERIDEYNNLLYKKIILPREGWEDMASEVMSIVEQTRESNEGDTSRLTTLQEFDVYNWLWATGRILPRSEWEIIYKVEKSRVAGEADTAKFTTESEFIEYRCLIIADKILPREEWFALEPEVMSAVEQSRAVGEEDTSRLTTSIELDVYHWLIASFKIQDRDTWEYESNQQ